MTDTQNFIENLPSEQRAKLIDFFGSTDAFYQTVYLMVQNGHMYQENKPEQWEDKLQTVKHYQKIIEELLDKWGLKGEDLVADIASDYFEDYVHYREPQITISQEQFIGNINKLKNV